MKLGKMIVLNEKIRKLIGNDIPNQQISVLLMIADKEGTTIGDLAKRLNLPLASVHRHVIKLSSKMIQQPNGVLKETGRGYVRTEDDPWEPRRKICFLTDQGKKIVGLILDDDFKI